MSSAVRRLMTEYKQLTMNPPDGILAGPVNEENFFEWDSYILGNLLSLFEFSFSPYCCLK